MIGLGAALLGSAGASAGGSILSTILNAKFQSGENELDRLNSDYLLRTQQAGNARAMNQQYNLNSKLMDKQMAFDERMANTQYQRTIADMEAAGLNPASLAGSSLGLAASPHAGLNSVSALGASASGGHGSNHLGAAIDLGSGAFNSAIAYMMRNDPQGAKSVSQAIVSSGMQEAKEAAAVDKFKEKTIEDYMKEWSKYHA